MCNHQEVNVQITYVWLTFQVYNEKFKREKKILQQCNKTSMYNI